MATFNQLATILAEQLKRPFDEPFKLMMKDRIKFWRSRLLKNTLDKDPRERKFFSQTLTVPMEEVNATDCGINLNCTLMRSKAKIPLPVRANGILFDQVGSVEGSTPFRLVKRYELSFLIGDKYAPLVSDFYLYENGYLITRFVPYLFVDGPFDDPEAVAAYNLAACQATGSEDCTDPDDADLGISGDIAQLIIQSIVQIDYGQPKKEPESDGAEVEVTPAKP
jgi:hypothetical protein